MPALKTHQDTVLEIAVMIVVIVATVAKANGVEDKSWATGVMILAALSLSAARHAPARARVPALSVAAASGLAGILLSPSGIAEVPTLMAAARLPQALAPRQLRVGVLALSAAFGVTVAVASGSLLGLLAGAGVALLAQRTVERGQLQIERDRAVALLAEVQASRDAQAEAAAAGERARIASEMHDVLAHSLAGLSLQLQAVRAVAAREGVGEVVTAPLERAAELAREGVIEARAAVGALSTPAGRGVDAIQALVSRFPGTASVVMTGSPVALAPEAGHAVYRAVQEALTNAARYAPGAAVTVELAWSPQRLVVTIADGGAVRPVALEQFGGGATGAGLKGMTARLEQVGGHLEAGPSGTGWRVSASVPVGPGEPA